MQVMLTKDQAKCLCLDREYEFVRAAFYTGHSMVHIEELVTNEVFREEREQIVSLALRLGMNNTDKVGVINDTRDKPAL